MKTIKFISHILLILLCFILQIFFLSDLGFLSNLNLILCFVIFLTLFDYPMALFWVFVGGFILGLNSLFPLGTYVLIFLITSLIVRYFLKNFFSHRSLYALTILIFIGFLIYNIELLLAASLFHWLKINDLYPVFDKIYFTDVLGYIFLNTLVTSFLVLFWGFQNQKKLNL